MSPIVASPIVPPTSLRAFSVRVLIVAAVALGALVMAPGTAGACTCVPREPAAVVKNASAIVIGTPVARTVDGTAVRYRVRVENSYKTRVPQMITVLTSSASAACGLDLVIGEQRMLVLGGAPDGLAPADGEWGASLCDNMSLTPSDVTEYAGAAITPYTDESQRSPTPTIIGAFVVLAVLVAIPGAIMWWRIRQRTRHPRFED